ncbi:MFS domain-containing protein [Aphelenchoides fujianensis]|nr:MFS domain-containing protein [Aphelenchoides fujianensis]
MVFGIDVWIAAVMGSTFIPADHFWAFLTLRGVVGVGEASYSVLAPTIIADIFTGTARSRVLMLFYFAIPVGAGLGFGIGSGVTRLMGDWRWGEPERGKAEKARGSQEEERGGGFRQILQDLLYLLKNITYIWSTIGVTTVVFVVGTLAWFATLAAARRNLEKLEENETTFIALFFGGIMTVGGILGAWKKGFLCFRACATQRADMIICAIGSAVATPFLFGGLHLFITSPAGAWVCIFVAVTALCLNWAVNMDCLLSIVVPKKRGLASAVQILISHLFGDASGPWIVGAMSDAIRGDDETPKGYYYNSLLYAFYLPSVLLVVPSPGNKAAPCTRPSKRTPTNRSPEVVVQPPENSAQ